MKTSELLIQAKAHIENINNWTQNTYARNAGNRAVDWRSNEACKFCSIGALKRTAWETTEWEKEIKCVRYLAEATEGKMKKILPITRVNDMLSHHEIMQIWDDAIKLAQIDERL